MGTDGAGTSQLWLVRHGETEWSAAGKHTGRRDVALTGAGEDAARRLAARLAGRPFAEVLSSPRSRARRTAELAGFGQPELVDDLVEWDYGEDEGLTTAEIRRHRPGWTVWTDGPRHGETAAEVGVRADRVIARVRAVPGATVVFGHGHFSRVLAARWVGLAPAGGSLFRLSTGGISVLGWDRETPAIDRWNDTGDLPDPSPAGH